MLSSHEFAIADESLVRPQCSNKVAVLGMINEALAGHESKASMPGYAFRLKPRDLDLLLRFHNRTAFSCAPQPLVDMFETESIRLLALVS